MVIISSRPGHISYYDKLEKIPQYLIRYFQKNSNIVIYPQQAMTHSKLGELYEEEDHTLIDLFSEGRKVAEKAGHFFNIFRKGKHKESDESQDY